MCSPRQQGNLPKNGGRGALSPCTVPKAGPYTAIHYGIRAPPGLSTLGILQRYTPLQRSVCFSFIPGRTSFQTLQSFKNTAAVKCPVDPCLLFAARTVPRPSISPGFSPPPERTLISQDARFL